MKYYKGRIPAISILWLFTWAESEDDAFDKFVSPLEKDNPKIQWRDPDVWEIQLVDPQPPDSERP